MITYLINALNHPLFAIIASYKMIICFPQYQTNLCQTRGMILLGSPVLLQAKAKLTVTLYLLPPWHVAWQTVSTARFCQDTPILRFSVTTNYVVLQAYDVRCLSTTLK